MSLSPVVCQHDPMTAQRFCLCDAACVCRVAGGCPAMSSDVMPATSLDEKLSILAGQAPLPADFEKKLEDAITRRDFTVMQCRTDSNQKCACGAHTEEGQHEATTYCTSEIDRAAASILDPLPKGAIEIVPPERLRAELASWQDEITKDDD